jgi:putative DNA primase/helicase
MSNEKWSLHELALDFLKETALDGKPTFWFWRGEWFQWADSHYQSVSLESIQREVLGLLKAKESIAISANVIRGIVDLMRLLQLCPANEDPSWLQRDGRPDPGLIFPVKNGLLHLPENRKPELLAHTPSYWSLSSAGYSYSRIASCDKWIAFLGQLWNGDFEARGILQEWFGYCLLRDTAQQKIVTILGPPRSGKSTIARVLTELLGRSNVANPSIRSLSGQFGLWGLINKSLAIVPDATLSKACPALEELLKSISGEDAMDVHRKGMAPLTGIRLPTRLMLLANELPAFHDPSGALRQRMIILRTERSFYGKEDIHLTNRLIEELPGILNWAIEGLARLWRRGHFPDKAPPVNAGAILDNLPDRNRVRKIVISYAKSSKHRTWWS